VKYVCDTRTCLQNIFVIRIYVYTHLLDMFMILVYVYTHLIRIHVYMHLQHICMIRIYALTIYIHVFSHDYAAISLIDTSMCLQYIYNTCTRRCATRVRCTYVLTIHNTCVCTIYLQYVIYVGARPFHGCCLYEWLRGSCLCMCVCVCVCVHVCVCVCV